MRAMRSGLMSFACIYSCKSRVGSSDSQPSIQLRNGAWAVARPVCVVRVVSAIIVVAPVLGFRSIITGRADSVGRLWMEKVQHLTLVPLFEELRGERVVVR